MPSSLISLVKKLAGVTLIERAIQTARGVVSGDDVVVVTDSQEISLICERAGVRHHYNPPSTSPLWTSCTACAKCCWSRRKNTTRSSSTGHSCPLITWVDIDDAWRRFMESDADCLVTVKSVRQRVWGQRGDTLDALLAGDEDDTPIYIESKSLWSFLMPPPCAEGRSSVRCPTFSMTAPLKSTAIRIGGSANACSSGGTWFVVAGYPAIGMGHIYRALMLAHEIAEHKITFLCTRERAGRLEHHRQRLPHGHAAKRQPCR